MSEAASPANMYSLHEARELCLRVYYPNVSEQLVLRTDLDWDKDVLPIAIDRKDSFAEFKLETTHPFLYLKPCLQTTSGLLWATGANRLVVATRRGHPRHLPFLLFLRAGNDSRRYYAGVKDSESSA